VGCLDEKQLEWLDAVLAARTDRPAIVVLHYPLDITPPYRLPPGFTKLNDEYSRKLHEIFDKHDRVKIVASGHFHCTTTNQVGGRLHLTTAAFSEAPFQVRLLEVTHSKITVKTVELHDPSDRVAPVQSKRHLNGTNQEFSIPLDSKYSNP
jgi:hypothetical protein